MMMVEKNVNAYQIHKKNIVSPIKSGMVIVDQQRAHQRVLYEQFLTNITVHQASSQQLLFPFCIIHLSKWH
jgi:DNA mismatch repair protein MutL